MWMQGVWESEWQTPAAAKTNQAAIRLSGDRKIGGKRDWKKHSRKSNSIKQRRNEEK